MFKKVLACVLAGAMVLGMTSVASAAVTGDVSYNNPLTISSEDFSSVNDFATLSIQGFGTEGTDDAYWNDWCAIGIIIESDGNTSYKAVVGQQVGWDISISGENTNDVLNADAIKTDETGAATVNVSGLGENWTITVKSMGWDDAPDCAYIHVDASGIGTPATDAGSVAPVVVVSVVAVVSAAVVVASKKRA